MLRPFDAVYRNSALACFALVLLSSDPDKSALGVISVPLKYILITGARMSKFTIQCFLITIHS